MRFAYILIKVERGQVREVAKQLIELDEVSEVHSISGPYDLIAKVWFPHTTPSARPSQIKSIRCKVFEKLRRSSSLMFSNKQRWADVCLSSSVTDAECIPSLSSYLGVYSMLEPLKYIGLIRTAARCQPQQVWRSG